MECVGWILAGGVEQRRLAAPALAAREGRAAGGTGTPWACREDTLGHRERGQWRQLGVPASEDTSWLEEGLEQLWSCESGAALDVPVQG